MREPGRFLLRLIEIFGLTRLRDTVVLPAVADMQHECASAGGGAGCAWALLRGYWSIFAGSAFYVALSPARRIRENWMGLDAPGPRLLRQAWPAMMLAFVLLVGIPGFAGPNDQHLDARIMVFLLPGLILSVAPLALVIGIGWALARDPSGSRAALSVGLIAAGISFGFFDFVVTEANQAYRVSSYEKLTGRSSALSRGSREMTFRELGAAAEHGAIEACPMGSSSSCAGPPRPGYLRVEWHNRLSSPVFCLSFMTLATVLARSRRRLVVVPALFAASVATNLLLLSTMRYGVAGDIPAFLAAWSPHLVPLSLAAVLHIRMRRHDLNTPIPTAG
jgi:hypothetical protein